MAKCSSGKRQYTSKQKARECAGLATSRRMRAYFCPECRSWYTTSMAEGRSFDTARNKNQRKQKSCEG